ncbi:MAG TPA: DUF542 domain-containing protein [Virgibacillus sp.]|nr:DUF542 domain-containing protein [Virgibacillus sp.]
MKSFTAEHTPADIVNVFPQASDLFKLQRINFCCSGDQPLRTYFTENSELSVTDVLTQLNADYQTWIEKDIHTIKWDQLSSTELIDHILEHHHSYLKGELPVIGEFVTRIYNVHGTGEPHLGELHRLYDVFKTTMEDNMMKEENELYPLIKEYENKPSEATKLMIDNATNQLKLSLQSATNLLDKMRGLTNGFRPPATACGSYKVTYSRLAELESNTLQHIHLENNLLLQ